MLTGGGLFDVLGTTPLLITDFHEKVGQGVSGAQHVEAEDGKEYLIKGPSLTEDTPSLCYTAANEHVATTLARRLGLSVLASRILYRDDRYFFGCQWLRRGTYYEVMDAPLFDRCTNKDCAYLLVAFDVWLCNADRHNENLIAREVPGGPQLSLIDHGHCLVWPEEKPADLARKVGMGPSPLLVQLPFLRSAIREARLLRQAIAQVQSVGSEYVQGVVASLPSALLPEEERAAVIEFICARMTSLRDVMARDRGFFRDLEGGDL